MGTKNMSPQAQKLLLLVSLGSLGLPGTHTLTHSHSCQMTFLSTDLSLTH